jgi:short subunit dehydrogenase-like uncharacterized protein
LSDPILIYGANGFTGELIAQRALERGLRPILAGRNSAAVQAVAGRLGLEARIAALDDPAALDAAMSGCTVVIHCAGPFSRTSRSMADACLRNGVHYLDITGEIAVFEALQQRDSEAQAAGVMLLPGAGFDVVPSDCLALHLKRRLADAAQLRLAFRAIGGISRGTATTAIEVMAASGAIRRDGQIIPVPPAHETREVDFGRGLVPTVAIPWGDVSSAYYSTGIPNITVYTALPPAARGFTRLGGVFGPLLGLPPVQAALRGLVRLGPPGPDAGVRERGLVLLWGEVIDAAGQRAVSRMRTPEGYKLTAITAVLIAEKVLAGDVRPGFTTPAQAYGPDLILEVPGVMREDL